MIRIHETHSQDIAPGISYKERNDLSVLDGVIALTECLNRKFVVHEARYKRLVVKVFKLGLESTYKFTGPVEDIKALLQTAFIYAVFRDNMRSQEVLRNIIENRDAFQEHLVDLNEAGTDWKVLALGVPLGMTDTTAMQSLYDDKLANALVVEEEPAPPAAKSSGFACEAVE